MKRHVVAEGECMSSIAVQYGFAPATLWELPENAELRQRRTTMFQLIPEEDVVMIPDLRPRLEPVRTGKRHVFRRLSVPERLRLRLRDAAGQPRSAIAYTLRVEERTYEGTTGSDGEIEHPIANAALSGELTLHTDPPEVYQLAIGRLLPVTETAGVQQRLKNLGYYSGAIDGTFNADTSAALERFQSDEQLEVTGIADEATRSQLDSFFSA